MRRAVLAALLSVLLPATAAQARPKIGLVLSGGGARGGAHLGVIEVFEKRHIPIDAIAGTSMGAFVGGLYASGMSSEAIETMLLRTDWRHYLRVDYNRKKIPFRRKQLQRAFPGNLQLGIDAQGNVAFRTGLFKRQYILELLKSKTFPVSYIRDFDELPIPFRAVATDLKNGDTVALSHGSLARAIYASISIPGAFEPIEIDGRTLVDGGISDNLPVDVMKQQMHVDIVVAVDISTPFDKDGEYDSFLSVIEQLTNILTRKNVERTLGALEKGDILITPDLKGISPLDAESFSVIITKGKEAAQKLGETTLRRLEATPSEYAAYRLAHRDNVARLHRCPVIDEVRIDNRTWLDDRAIRSRLHVEGGKRPGFPALQRDIASIYNLTLFDEVDCRYVQEAGKNVLTVKTRPAKDIDGQIKFAFGFEDDFNGRSDYSAKLEYVMFGLNRYGGEWRTRATIGIERLFSTEWYQPLDVWQRFYVRPLLFYRNKKVYVNPAVFSDHHLEAPLDESVIVQAREYGATFALGANLGNTMQLEAGATYKEAAPSTGRYIVDGNDSVYTTVSESQKVLQYYLHLRADTFDNPFFPSEGYVAAVKLRHTRTPGESVTTSYSQAYATATGAYSYRDSTLLFKLSGGKTFDTEAFDAIQDFNAFFTLGGLFNLSGLPTNALTGDEMLFGALIFRQRLTPRGFFGNWGFPLYAGASVETGDAWYSHYGTNNALREDIMNAGSVYLAADTVLGPFYFAVGMAEGGYQTLYLSLGKSF